MMIPWGSVSAQDVFGNYDMSRQDQIVGASDMGLNPFASDEEEPADTTRKARERKPFESYFFPDSIALSNTFVWHVDTYRNKLNMSAIDSVLYDSHIYYPYQRLGVGDAYQGSLGGASIPLSYFDRPRFDDYTFASPFYSYLWTPENANFYNVKVPFSQFSYYWGGQKKKAEESFHIIHAQNISPSTGFNVDYKSRGKRGDYDNERGRAKNLSVALQHTGQKYSLHAGYIFNTTQNYENGGLVNDLDLGDTDFELPENIPVRLGDARNTFKNNTYYVVQSYGIPLRKLTEDDFSIADRSSIFVGHSFTYSRWGKVYSDTRANSQWTETIDIEGEEPQTVTHEYYDNWYINPIETRDSLFESVMTNRVFMQIQPFDREGVIGTIDAGIGMDNHRYYQFSPGDYISGDFKAHKETAYYAYGAVEGKIKRYADWGGDLKIHPTGYRSGDLSAGAHASVSAFIKGKPVTLSGKFSYERRSPGYWESNYFSNHYAWSNSFDKENETRIEAALLIPSFDLEVRAWQSVVNNKIYYNASSLPTQHDGSVSVTGVYARKDFRLGGFHLNHRVLLQWSSAEEIIPVPLASAFLAYYFEFNVVRNVLRVQVGFDARYNTPYYAFGYNPSVMAFYNQREKEVGGYPMIDAFVSAKWKRMRILVKYQHVNNGLFGGEDYFMLHRYPQNAGVMKLGISWNFYD